MSKPVNKTLVGLFVLGAVALVVFAVALFGSGKFFVEKPKYVMYFPGSVNGLDIGSPIQFRGVKIGRVTGIFGSFDKNMDVVIAVYVEYNPDSLTIPEELKREAQRHRYPFIQRLIAKGLKAQLRMKSLITGQLYVALDFYPNKPVVLVGLDESCPEIPTIPSPSDVIMSTLENIPLAEISDKLLKVTEGVDRIVNSPEIKESTKSLNTALKDLAGLIRNIDAEIKPLSTSLIDTSTAARGAFLQAEKTLAFNEGKPGEVAENLNNTLKKANATLEEMRLAITSYEKIADRNMDLGYEVSKTLKQIEGAARSIRSLTEFLERHPEALVKGKQLPKGE